jgi:ankyrin repeat protein
MLYNAVFKGNVKRCSVLLSLGANDIDSNLWLAARWGHIEIVKLLILKDGDVNYKLGGNGDSILEAALDNLGKKKDSNYDVIKYLLDKGANLNLELFNGQNLLQIAIREEDVGEKIILLLIDKGADLNHKDNSGATPLHYACEDEYLKEIAVYLINKGANVNIRDNKGRSPIFNAIEFCDDLEMIKILVENGAEFELIDKNGITPLNFAKEKGRNDVVNFFIEKLTLAGKNK